MLPCAIRGLQFAMDSDVHRTTLLPQARHELCLRDTDNMRLALFEQICISSRIKIVKSNLSIARVCDINLD